MTITLKPLCLVAAGLLLAAPAWAVDLIGVHDLAVENDPRLLAAAFRREATAENKAIARANLLPQIGGSASLSRGDSETEIPGFPAKIESDIDTNNYRLDLRQSLYRQANYETLDDADRSVFFILRAKCPILAGYMGVPTTASVLMHHNPG